MEQQLEDVRTAAALLLEQEGENPLLRQCVKEAVEEALSWCGIAELPEDCIIIAARRAAALYEGADVKSIRRGDFSVSYKNAAESFYKNLSPYRRMRF